MSRLIIIDQSLKGIGGHHYDHTLLIAKAASQMGLEVIAATHQSFSDVSDLKQFAQVGPHFRKTTYNRHSLLNGLRSMHGQAAVPPAAVQNPTNKSPFLDSSRLPVGNFKEKDSKRFGGPLASSFNRPRTLTALRDRMRRFLQLKNGIRWLEARRRQKSISIFSKDCARFFKSLGLSDQDHVFFTTISDLELAGLLNYWLHATESYLPQWHLQFHFDVFSGRPHQYKKELESFTPLTSMFADIEKAVPSHLLNYYATTKAIAFQYQQLCLRPVMELVYPIACQDHNLPSGATSWQPTLHTVVGGDNMGAFGDHVSNGHSIVDQPIQSHSLTLHSQSATHSQSESATPQDTPADHSLPPAEDSPVESSSAPMKQDSAFQPATQPITIALAGGIRSEKGQKSLQAIMPDLFREVFDPGLGVLKLQRRQKNGFLKKKPFTFGIPEGTVAGDAAFTYLPHPLSTDAYQDFIRSTGIGLITYNPETYHSRRAGIFGEYLAAGVPVLVPAGCWMADQIQAVDQRYRMKVLSDSKIVSSWSHSVLDWAEWNLPSADGSISFDGRSVPARASGSFSPSKTGNHRILNFQFHWTWPKTSGHYCNVHAVFYDANDQVLRSAKSTIGNNSSQQQCGCLFDVPPAACRFHIGLTNSYDDRCASVNRIRVDLLQGQTSIATPVGSIGRTFQSPQQIPALLAEMCLAYSHYRSGALSYRKTWQAMHDPSGTVKQILDASQSSPLAWAG